MLTIWNYSTHIKWTTVALTLFIKIHVNIFIIYVKSFKFQKILRHDKCNHDGFIL